MKQTKIQLILTRYFEANTAVNDTETSFISAEQECVLVPVHFYEECVQLTVIKTKKALALWTYPQKKADNYHYCPDERMRIRRITGQPSIGLLPPLSKQIQ